MVVSWECGVHLVSPLRGAMDGPRQLVGIREKAVRRDLCRAARLSLRSSRLQGGDVLRLGALIS
jgi:hypothetical protein